MGDVLQRRRVLAQAGEPREYAAALAPAASELQRRCGTDLSAMDKALTVLPAAQ